MEIAIVGGTGALGTGLALRWGRDSSHEISIGSRERSRAKATASSCRDQLTRRGYEAAIAGMTNERAVAQARVVVLSVPPYSIAAVVETLASDVRDEAILVSPAVGLRRTDEGVQYHQPAAGSVTDLVATAAPEHATVVGAFHTLPAGRLRDLDDTLGVDTVVVGETSEARSEIVELANDIDGLRGLDGGSLRQASVIESMTPLLMTLEQQNDELVDPAIKIISRSS